jgi:hypothetical protein
VDPKELFHDIFYIHQPRTWQVPAVPELEFFAPLEGTGGIYQYDLCTGYGEIEKVSVVYRGAICDECLKFPVPFLTAVSRATTAGVIQMMMKTRFMCSLALELLRSTASFLIILSPLAPFRLHSQLPLRWRQHHRGSYQSSASKNVHVICLLTTTLHTKSHPYVCAQRENSENRSRAYRLILCV